MKKLFAIAAMAAFTFGMAQEAPKKSCCAGKDAKECKMDGKKMSKTCDMKNHTDCKKSNADKSKKAVKKVA